MMEIPTHHDDAVTQCLGEWRDMDDQFNLDKSQFKVTESYYLERVLTPLKKKYGVTVYIRAFDRFQHGFK